MIHLLLIICLLFTYVASVHDIKLLNNIPSLSLMVGQHQDVTIPVALKNYQEVNITLLNSNISVCEVEDVDLSIHLISHIYLKEFSRLVDVITSYDYLLNTNYLIDMVYYNKILYLVFSDGVKVVEYDGKLEKKFTTIINARFQKAKLLENVTSSSTVYFITNNSIFKIDKKTTSPVFGYSKVKNFVTACVLNLSVIAVLDKFEGISLYQLTNDSATFLYTFRKEYFGWDINLIDIISYQNKSLLLLDAAKGIFRIDVISDITKSPLKSISNASNCQTLKLDNDTLYVGCRQLHIIKLELHSQKILATPDFRIGNILILNNRPAITGKNLVKIYNGNYEIDSHLNFQIDKIISDGNKFIIGNKHGVKIVSWDVTQPVITCGVKKDVSNPGILIAMIDIVAECNIQYLSQNNIHLDLDLDQDKDKDNTCMYHFPMQIQFWTGQQIDYSKIKIILLVFLSILLGIFVLWLFFRRKIGKLRGFLLRYKNLEQNSSMVVEDKMKKNYEKFQESLEDAESSSKRAQQQMHQIGD